MKSNAMITEKVKIDSEVLGITSAAGTTSLNYDMQNYNRAAIVVNVQGNYTTATLDLMETSAATVAGSSAAGGSAGIVIGGASTLVPVAGGVRQMTLTMGTASTTGQYFGLSLGTVTKKFTYSTSTGTTNVSTNSYFGSTVGSTVGTGVQLSMDSLKTAINSTLAFGSGIVCSTLTTAGITLTAADDADGVSLGLSATAVMTAVVNQAVGAFNIAADELASTANKRYVGVKVSTAATSCDAAVTVLRTGGRYNPPTFSGKLST